MWFNKRKNVTSNIQWYRRVATDYLIVNTWAVLERVGFFDLLRKDNTPRTIEELSLIIGAQKDILEPCVLFLWSTTEILKKEQNMFSIKNLKHFPRGFVLSAYKPVFDNLEDLLLGKKQYGTDVLRDGYELQKASGIFTGEALDYVLSSLKKILTPYVLIDLGCGSGEFLIHAHIQNLSVRGIGIDVDTEAVGAAQKATQKNNLESKIHIFQADVENIDYWKKYIPSDKKLVFVASTILHEFLKKGDERFVNYLEALRRAFPGSCFFVIEYDALSFEEIKENRNQGRALFAAMYAFWHPLSDQGIPQPKHKWLSFFKEAGWVVEKTDQMSNHLIVYQCRL